jgi:uncharacterized membrane protein (UPF0127 family)
VSRPIVNLCAVASRALVLLIALEFLVAPVARAQDDTITFERDTLVVRTAQGDLPFEVELATTPRQRARGLMERRSLGPHAGMLFVFEEPREASFWMKNTYIPLDLLFIDVKGRIVRIAANATPESETPIPSGAVVLGVLEIAGSRAAEAGIAVGDRVLHPSFRAGP